MSTSVERDDVKHRIDLLRECDAKIKFLSIEPLIGRINNIYLTDINWVIVGGESGPGARPLKKNGLLKLKMHVNKQMCHSFLNNGGSPNLMLMKPTRLSQKIIHNMRKAVVC